MTNALAFDRYCAEIIEQTRLFRDTLKGVKLDSRVPTCPDWTVRDLAVHLGNGHRRAAEVVRTRATSFLAVDDIPGHGGPPGVPEAHVAPDAYAEALSNWLSESAQLVSDELRVAGEESPAWTFTGDRHAAFWARRRTHETLVHRVDAAAAAGSSPGEPADEADAADGADAADIAARAAAGFPAALAADCIDEFLELTSSREALTRWPALRSLREHAGETLHLHATDASFPEPRPAATEWLIRIGDEGFVWEHAHEKATTAVRGPLTDLLLVMLRRAPAGRGRVEVLGEAGLLDFWLERVCF
ncbi:maleylpyruvate isomerase N-terminal domain-containing protein [Streptomyces marispadix]|uniref:Maleylpyruvate isomerase N-terminal domain-containing protein n=1 Tax=Streptomyces marispadix TaxID=2922868 RepID=A0ABS9SXZ5_9ACTN|nr:maleylpyruvate isomerase N-terminal domain-containing protein [Streptomyces marispadix]MCH6161149.1 maleylpyruvate isomerase N-terminal domain-containing protein [Streptomyces marispadix]